MKELGLVFLFALTLSLLMTYCESRKDPLEEGTHMDYSIECHEGFKYKNLGSHKGTILLLNKEGRPMKCGK